MGYTRRQVCYLAAKALTGAHLDGTLPQDTLFFPPQVSQSRRSHSCSLGACQHRCNEVVIEMASHAICQRKACWVVRFETPNQNVLGSFCFHLEWSECFTLLYDFKVLNCNGFASRSATNERERERSCKHILKRHASICSCILIVLERALVVFFPQDQEAVSLGKMPLAELCLHCWRPVQLTPLWKAADHERNLVG